MHTIFLLFISFNFVTSQTLVDTAANLNFVSLLAALDATNLRDTVNNNPSLTLLAPTNEAFASFAIPAGFDLETIMRYHIIDGLLPSSAIYNDLVITNTLANNNTFMRFNIYDGEIYVNGKRFQTAPLNSQFAQIIAPDIPASNGIMHVISNVLVPPTAMDQRTILQEIETNPMFSTLREAINIADLNLSNLSAYTFFAPTNEAFAAVPPGVLALILGDPNALRQFLLYGVVPSTYFSVALGNETLQTLEGNPIAIFRPTDDTTTAPLFVNGALANPIDIHRLDGVIHVMTRVLVPPDLCLSPVNDGGDKLAGPSFWCHQLRAGSRGFSRCSVYTSSELLSFVQWIARTSGYFSTTTTLQAAANRVCSVDDLVSNTYALWLDAASGNVFMGTSVSDFCSWVKYGWNRPYNKYCTQVYYKQSYNGTSPNGLVTISDVLSGAESSLYSNNWRVRNSYADYVDTMFDKQAPGSGFCPNTCGASASAARALSTQVKSFSSFDETTGENLSLGAAAAIGAGSTFFVLGLSIVLVVFLLRDKIVNFLSRTKN